MALKLLIDTREIKPLEFPVRQGVDVLRQGLTAGDYTALHQHGTIEQLDPTVFERKSIPDLFSSFTAGYDQEKAKWSRLMDMGLAYILAVEGTASEVLKGHTYWAQGERHEAKKSGLAQLRQLLSVMRRYGLHIWFCSSRQEMALLILEYFLAKEREP